MRDEGRAAPAAAPAMFVPPVLVRTPPRSFVPSLVLRSYRMCSFEPPALPSCSLVLARSLFYRPQGSVRTPCTRSNTPALVRTARTRLVLARSRLYHPWGSVRTPCTHSSPLPCSPRCCRCHCAYAFAGSLVSVPCPAFAFLSVVPYL